MSLNSRKQKIVVFAGAGASKAVSPKHFPTTFEFFQRLPDEISENALFQRCCGIAKKEFQKNEIDIENVLWSIENAIDPLNSLLEGSSPISSILNKGNNSSWFSVAPNIGNFFTFVDNLRSDLKNLQSNINKNVYNFYSHEPEESEIGGSWLKILEYLSELDCSLDIFTTNYDFVIENSLQAFRDKNNVALVDVGWTKNQQERLDIRKWNRETKFDGRGLLTKLHGSLNWKWEGESILRSDARFSGSHDRHAIIYPGFKGIPDKPAFAAFHRYFERALLDADVAVFIGFAFRDEYISSLCTNRFGVSSYAIIVDPNKDLIAPFSSGQYHQIRSGFDSSSVQLLTKQISKHLAESKSL